MRPIDFSVYFKYIIKMTFIENAVNVVHRAEKAVTDLVRQAVEQQDYAAAILLIKLAGELRGIAERAQPTRALVPIEEGVDSGAVAAPVDASEARLRSARHRPKKAEFPKFLRDEKTLFKLGWSKAEKAVY